MVRQPTWGQTFRKSCRDGGILLLLSFVKQCELFSLSLPASLLACSFVWLRSLWLLSHASCPFFLLLVSLLSSPSSFFFLHDSFVSLFLFYFQSLGASASRSLYCWHQATELLWLAGFLSLGTWVFLPSGQVRSWAYHLLQSTSCYLATNYTYVT